MPGSMAASKFAGWVGLFCFIYGEIRYPPLVIIGGFIMLLAVLEALWALGEKN